MNESSVSEYKPTSSINAENIARRSGRPHERAKKFSQIMAQTTAPIEHSLLKKKVLPRYLESSTRPVFLHVTFALLDAIELINELSMTSSAFFA